MYNKIGNVIHRRMKRKKIEKKKVLQKVRIKLR